MVRAGHPWVFRDSLARDPGATRPETLIRLLDPDGVPRGWGLWEPTGAIAVRMVSWDTEPDWGPEPVLARVRAAAEHRAASVEPGNLEACRVVHGEGDGLPGFAVDRFGDYLVVYKYTASAETYREWLLTALETIFSPRGIYLQDRQRPIGAEDGRVAATLVRGRVAPNEVTVVEDGLKFAVDVTAPVSPGLFLDLREGRRWCEVLASGRRVLNLFSFTGAFALRALRGGAKEVVNVDSAARSHARCRQNLTANGMDPESCESVTGDAIKHLERLDRKGRRFDLVIVDPPPFSRSKEGTFSALRDWHELTASALRASAPGGLVLAVSNAAHHDSGEFLTALGRGSMSCGRRVRLIGERGLPSDFPIPPAFAEGRYLKIKLLRVE